MRRASALTGTGALLALLVVVPAGAAQAHPLGNFTVNHYNGLTLRPDEIDLLAVVDLAEIPTQQELPAVDTNGDGDLAADELAAHAASQCADLAAAVDLAVDGAEVLPTVDRATLVTVAGAAGLPTLRVTCQLSAAADLSAAATLTFTDDYRGDRVGWHELTARGDGVRLLESTVPSESVSDELRSYPDDLLSSPLDDRSVSLRTEPGVGDSVAGPATRAPSQDPLTRLLAWGDRTLQASLGEDDLTPVVGGLAVVLSVLLGAGHALLPGHGKTVMAAYLAGRRGSRRDALTVGGIVTLTHTASVLVLGLAITVFASVAGEQALRYLGVISGLLIAVVGAMLLRDAVRSRRSAGSTADAAVLVPARMVGSHARVSAFAPGRSYGPAHGDAPGHSHDGHSHDDHSAGDHSHDGHSHDGHRHDGHSHDGHSHDGHSHDGHSHSHDEHAEPGHAHADDPGEHSHAHDHTHDEQGHGHDHTHDERSHGHDHEHGHEHTHSHDEHSLAHNHGGATGWLGGGHSHGTGPGQHTHGAPGAGGARAGIVGMGIAGGLVPSPSALVVLLGAVGLGRTVFGVLLVLLYGLGMAATLTAVGLLLVRMRNRLERSGLSGRLGTGAMRVAAALPVVTALLVLVVGLGLAVRGLVSPV